MKNSLELELIIKSINFSMLESSKLEFNLTLKENKINWQRFERMVNYHSLRPIAYNYLSKFQIANFEIQENLKTFSLQQAISNLSSINEIFRILKILQIKQINSLPYKGLIFLSEFYQNRPLREMGDFDLIVHPKKAKEALIVLLNDGYCFSHDEKMDKENFEKEIEIILSKEWINELGLFKKLANGYTLNIDFHWGFTYGYLPYNINLDNIFSNTKELSIKNFICKIPSDQTLFIMLIIHHGGRNFWLNLKYIVDLLAFYQTKGQNMNWEEVLIIFDKMKMKKTMVTGFFLLQKHFQIIIPKEIENEFSTLKINNRFVKPIESFWENHQMFNRIKPRITYELMLIKLQDKDFNVLKYYTKMFKMYGYNNPLNEKKLLKVSRIKQNFRAIQKIIKYILR